MRIAIFHELPKKSGSRKSVDKIAEYLSKNHEIDLYYVEDRPSYPKKNPYKTFFFQFKPVIWNGNDPFARLYRDSIELIKLFFLHQKIAKKIRMKKYDALFIHGSYLTESPFLLLFKNTFKIYYAHAPNYTLVYEKVMGTPKKDRARYLYEKITRHIRRLIDKANVRSANLILANSIYTKTKIQSFYGKKSTVSYLGVDTSLYKPTEIKKKYEFLFVGSLHPVDGYGLIHGVLEKMKKKPQYKILAIENEWIEDDKEMARLYNSSKVVFCLSHGEPFGLVAIEALACGIPVIAVDEAGYKETVINNNTGILIPRSSEALKKALSALIKDEKRYSHYSKNARKQALAKWSWRVSVKRMESLIERKVV